MHKVKIGTKEFSKSFWNKIFAESSALVEEKFMLFKLMNELEELVDTAQVPTGSIPPFSCFVLYCLTKHLQPKNILEVGTYIGKSTLSMAYGLNKKDTEIHTCDFSNKLSLPNPTRCKIVQYYGPSTQMFEHILKENERKFDMINLDGRISIADIDKIIQLIEEETVICLDDFEGIEKGVSNYKTLIESGKFSTYALVYPPEESFIKQLQFTGSCTTALMVPQSLISFVRQ